MTPTDMATPLAETHSKTVVWHAPQEPPATAGLEFLRAMADEQVPGAPISALFGMRLLSAGEGDVVFTCTPDESMYNAIGLVHGGVACTLLDSAAGCAVHSTLAAGVLYTSIEIKVSYLRPIRADAGELRAHGWVTKPGRRVAFAEADLRDADGTVLATATSACLIIGG